MQWVELFISYLLAAWLYCWTVYWITLVIILQPASIASIIIIQLLSVLLEMDSLVSYACTYNIIWSLSLTLCSFFSLSAILYVFPSSLSSFLSTTSFLLLPLYSIYTIPACPLYSWLDATMWYIPNQPPRTHWYSHIWWHRWLLMSHDCHVMHSLSPPLSSLLSLPFSLS